MSSISRLTLTNARRYNGHITVTRRRQKWRSRQDGDCTTRLPVGDFEVLQELSPDVDARVEAVDDRIDDSRGAVDDVEGRVEAVVGRLTGGDFDRILVGH